MRPNPTSIAAIALPAGPLVMGTDIPPGAVTVHRILDDDEPEKPAVIPPLAMPILPPKKKEAKVRTRRSPTLEKLVDELGKESPQTTARLQKACGMSYAQFVTAAIRAKKRKLIEYEGVGDSRMYWLFGTKPKDKPKKVEPKYTGKNAREVNDFILCGPGNPIEFPPPRAIATEDGGVLLVVGNTITHELSPAQRAAIVGLAEK